MTDGMENASREFKKDTIREMIQHQEGKYSWEVVFLGANFDAFHEGVDMGFAAGKSFTYASNSLGVIRAFDSLTRNAVSYRTGALDSMDFNASDRDAQKDAGAEDSSEN